MKVLAFGEILWDIIEDSEHLGGAPFNFAAHMAQCGNDAFIISRIGKDPRGTQAFIRSNAHGVNGSMIQWDDVHPTGVVDVTLNSGQPDYIIRENTAYDYISADNTLAALSEKHFDVFYFGSLAQRHFISEQTLYKALSTHQFRHIFYDVNLRKSGYSEDIIRRSLGVCSIFKLNADEVAVISSMILQPGLLPDEFCKGVKQLYPNIEIIIITAAESGCYVYEQELIFTPGFPVTVRDAVGAGDAFSAAFMHVYATCADAVSAAKIANKVGAFVATQTGAIPPYSPEIRDLLINMAGFDVPGSFL